MENSYEGFLQQSIFPELEKGRPNFDEPHTESVVAHLKQIIARSPELNLDKDVLVIAAHAHDWGYSGLFQDGKPITNYADVANVKVEHAKIGAQKVGKLLENPLFDFLTSSQKERVIHLVSVHDRVEELTDPDELVLMEADTLGGLDVDRVKPTFDQESNAKYMTGVRRKRLSRFITEYGKQQFERLFKLREDYYSNLY